MPAWITGMLLLFYGGGMATDRHSAMRWPGPWPNQSFQRCRGTGRLSLSTIELLDSKIRGLIDDHAISPTHRGTPWLADSFMLLS